MRQKSFNSAAAVALMCLWISSCSSPSYDVSQPERIEQAPSTITLRCQTSDAALSRFLGHEVTIVGLIGRGNFTWELLPLDITRSGCRGVALHVSKENQLGQNLIAHHSRLPPMSKVAVKGSLYMFDAAKPITARSKSEVEVWPLVNPRGGEVFWIEAAGVSAVQ